MVPAWPQVLSQVLSQPCPKSWPNPVPMSLFPVLSPWPGQGSIRQVQVGPSGQDWGQGLGQD